MNQNEPQNEPIEELKEEMKGEIQKLKDKIIEIENDKNRLSEKIWDNDFKEIKLFNKKVGFNNQINLKNLSANPTQGEVGDLASVNGKLVICTTASKTSPTFTIVGTQL